MATGPILSLRLTGEEYVATLSEDISWSPVDKIEATYTMKSGDAAKTITFSNVEKPRLFIFFGTGSFNVAITSSANTITHAVQSIFIFDPTQVFSAAITTLQISTSEVNDIQIECRIYGE